MLRYLKIVRFPPYQGGSPRLSAPPLSRGLSLIGIFLNNFCSKHSNPYPDLISVFSLSVRVSTRNITNC
ncbi:hypothetical protein B5D77_21960 [Microcystis sp. MC19]|nr:hypothetical protein B5D77_21960 [Microcystis sp. MC19]